MRALIHLCLLCAGAFVFALPATGQITDPANGTTVAQVAKEDRYRIGFQDVLDISVFRHGDLNKRQRERHVDLFRLGAVVAVCKTEGRAR